MGRTASPRPWLQIVERGGTAAAQPDGTASDDGRIWGCYLHGLFANDAFRQAWLRSLGADPSTETRISLEQALERLADGVAACLDWQRFDRIIPL